MTFTASWHNLLENAEELPADATLLTPLSGKPFRITDVQEHRILIEYRGDDGTIPLKRDQFETLYEHVTDGWTGFDLDNLPPDAGPYATVLSLHPRFSIDDREGMLTESDTPTSSPLVDAHEVEGDEEEREEPDIPVYADALLLIDALERHDPTGLDGLETPALVNLYTLLSDVQRNANGSRRDGDAGAGKSLYAAVRRTTERQRSPARGAECSPRPPPPRSTRLWPVRLCATDHTAESVAERRCGSTGCTGRSRGRPGACYEC